MVPVPLQPFLMRKTLLFHVHTFLVGGIEKVLLELLHALDPAKYRIILSIAHKLDEKELWRDRIPAYVEVRYILDKPILNYVKKKKKTEFVGIYSKVLKAVSEITLPYFIKRIHRTKLRAWAQEADVIIDFDMTLSGYTDALGSTRKVAYCHFSLARVWRQRYKVARLVKRLENYDRIVMLCDEMQEEAATLYPTLASKLVRVYNALDLDRVRTLSKETLGAFEYLRENGFFVSIGRLQASQKDFATVIRAYADAVRKTGLKQWLVIVGQGSAQSELQELADREGVGERLIFTGYQENPFKWMACADLFLFASLYEGLPTVLIEALALKKAIIATACPTGVREILMQGKAGSLVPVGDWQAMSLEIAALLNDEPRRDLYAANATSFLSQFDIKYVMQEFEQKVLN